MANEDLALKGYPFQVLFAADENDNVKITVRWSADAPPAKSVSIIASMLHHISAGHWKVPMVTAVKNNNADNQQVEVSDNILRQWTQAIQKVSPKATCVGPRQVFAKRREVPSD